MYALVRLVIMQKTRGIFIGKTGPERGGLPACFANPRDLHTDWTNTDRPFRVFI